MFRCFIRDRCITYLFNGTRSKRGDEIIVPSFSWISTASVIKLLDAKPIFIDIENETCNIDIKKLSKAISKKTKGIIFTSLFGNVPDVDKINKIAKNHKLFVIEDGAQSFGAKYKSGYSCNLTTIGCTSFFPSKPLGALETQVQYLQIIKIYSKK